MSKILLLSECSYRNPTFRVVLDSLAREYACRGHSVRVAAPFSPNGLSAPKAGGRRRASWGALVSLGKSRRPSEAVEAIYAQTLPHADWAECVHLHLVGDYTELVPRLDARLRFARTPVLATFHDYLNPSIRRTPESVAGYAALLRGRRVTALSRYGRNLLLEDFPFLKGRIAVVPEGARLETPARGALQKPFVLCPAWQAYYKAPDVLLMAWAGLQSPPTLAFAGQEHGGHARALARRLGLIRSGKVKFLGQISHRRMLGLMAESEFVVLPSRHEFFGMAALEAMALGKAVAASATGPADFIKDGASGLLVPPGQIAPLSSALRRLLDDAPLRLRLGQAAERAAQRYTWESAAGLYLDLI
ncbi:MAG TPA: glycosyltransferase family 4 protein [Elusimicrobiota bacterium]|nr:glycosyltransferase family 4 protein [Elusimicrobiota bacterium]